MPILAKIPRRLAQSAIMSDKETVRALAAFVRSQSHEDIVPVGMLKL
jgi:hypothetical protein